MGIDKEALRAALNVQNCVQEQAAGMQAASLLTFTAATTMIAFMLLCSAADNGFKLWHPPVLGVLGRIKVSLIVSTIYSITLDSDTFNCKKKQQSVPVVAAAAESPDVLVSMSLKSAAVRSIPMSTLSKVSAKFFS
jgi:hypothetical protein